MSDRLLELAREYGVETRTAFQAENDSLMITGTQPRSDNDIAMELLAKLPDYGEYRLAYDNIVGWAWRAGQERAGAKDFESAVIALAERAKQ